MTSIVEYIPWIVNPFVTILRRMELAFDSARATLAANIRRLRQEVGLSQEGLALAAEVDRSYVSQIEREIGNPSLLILCRLAGVLGVEVVTLLQAHRL
ncbi:MAG: helix-turn-helix domain-containing protein [Candidatus Nitricoxidivorans perseverans]|uniref:Helix-turn-helix domain-containing protein n=1 Tax=Candidatus Nitricoxidivorans perseverans TaxID=2975601 RepID=A0AA49FKE9_9PROT|nr:MAG: helix-turn-helix domain-containing protein [Candidatus Nitricoxidivorans perseverans]